MQTIRVKGILLDHARIDDTGQRVLDDGGQVLGLGPRQLHIGNRVAFRIHAAGEEHRENAGGREPAQGRVEQVQPDLGGLFLTGGIGPATDVDDRERAAALEGDDVGTGRLAVGVPVRQDNHTLGREIARGGYVDVAVRNLDVVQSQRAGTRVVHRQIALSGELDVEGIDLRIQRHDAKGADRGNVGDQEPYRLLRDRPFHRERHVAGTGGLNITQRQDDPVGVGGQSRQRDVVIVRVGERDHANDMERASNHLQRYSAVPRLDIAHRHIHGSARRAAVEGHDEADVPKQEIARLGDNRRNLRQGGVLQSDPGPGRSRERCSRDQPARGRNILSLGNLAGGLSDRPARRLESQGDRLDIGVEQRDVPEIGTGPQENLAIFAQRLEHAAQGGFGLPLNRDAALPCGACAGEDLDGAVRHGDPAADRHIRPGSDRHGVVRARSGRPPPRCRRPSA